MARPLKPPGARPPTRDPLLDASSLLDNIFTLTLPRRAAPALVMGGGSERELLRRLLEPGTICTSFCIQKKIKKQPASQAFFFFGAAPPPTSFQQCDYRMESLGVGGAPPLAPLRGTPSLCVFAIMRAEYLGWKRGESEWLRSREKGGENECFGCALRFPKRAHARYHGNVAFTAAGGRGSARRGEMGKVQT